jgi:RNA recognition motif-containing protein
MQGGRDMDGGRGRAGGRDSGPPRGADRLSNHTSDASMANARIFVGNLPTGDTRLNKELLEENFGQYGRILGKNHTHKLAFAFTLRTTSLSVSSLSVLLPHQAYPFSKDLDSFSMLKRSVLRVQFEELRMLKSFLIDWVSSGVGEKHRCFTHPRPTFLF